MAKRIQARAIRRSGELLKQIEPGTKHNAKKQREGDHPSNRKQTARDAGLSKHQQVTATRVANVPDEEFTAMVESDNPPTVTKLAEIGTKRQLIDLKGRDPKEFNKALHFVAAFENYARDIEQKDIAQLTAILDESERKRLRNAINKIDSIHDKVMKRI